MRQLGLVFPGQGTQYVGMGSGLYRAFRRVRDVYAEASDVLGFDIASLCFEGPQEELDRTVNTQVAVLTTDVAIYRIFEEQTGGKPLVMAGHSLGEYSALCAAGALRFADALPLVFSRGKYQQEAAPEGTSAMAAVIGLDAGEVEAICRDIRGKDGAVFPAIINTQDQIVLSGHIGALDRAIAMAKERGARRAVRLAVSVPCHCPLLDEAAVRFAGDLAKIELTDGRISVIPNCDPGALHSRETSRDLLIRQINTPVYWQASIERMVRMGVDTIVEIGPKRTLTSLTKRIDAGVRAANVEDLESLGKIAELLRETDES